MRFHAIMKAKLLLFAILFALTGCCHLLKVSQLPGVGFTIVAEADRLPDYRADTSGFGMGGRQLAVFRVKKVHVGILTNEIVLVEYYTNAVGAASLPDQAILVGTEPFWFYGFGEDYIHRGTMGAIWPPGGEPVCGILPNTSSNRVRIATELGFLLRNPPNKWIDKEMAISIAQKGKDDVVSSHASRYSHGWVVYVKDSLAYYHVFVGDDGRIKDLIGGL